MTSAADLLAAVAADAPALAGVEPVTRVTLPARLAYTYTPGAAQSRFLTGLADKRLLAERCPVCTRVYIPPRGVCPTCGRATTEQLELPHVGTVTTFCIVNIAARGLNIEVPYCYAYVLLDGAHVGLHARIGGIPHDQVHVGQRVEAVWDDANLGPSLAGISHFRPTGDPDADPDTYRSWM
ncbi:putative OB-fold protein [Streptacidiphilus sp. EB129]